MADHTPDAPPVPFPLPDTYPMVLIEWEDITNTAEWASAKQIKKWRGFEHDHRCWSLGFLVAEEDDCLVLAAQATHDFKALAMATRIPRAAALKIVFMMDGPGAAIERTDTESLKRAQLDYSTTRDLLVELADRMGRTQNSTKGREIGALCREATEKLALSILEYSPMRWADEAGPTRTSPTEEQPPEPVTDE